MENNILNASQIFKNLTLLKFMFGSGELRAMVYGISS